MAIFVNIPKAKEIWKDKIRVARKPALEKLDADYAEFTESVLKGFSGIIFSKEASGRGANTGIT